MYLPPYLLISLVVAMYLPHYLLISLVVAVYLPPYLFISLFAVVYLPPYLLISLVVAVYLPPLPGIHAGVLLVLGAGNCCLHRGQNNTLHPGRGGAGRQAG